jgi:hypothetical protein
LADRVSCSFAYKGLQADSSSCTIFMQ